jgi:DNA-3-methyladenine glycosylase
MGLDDPASHAAGGPTKRNLVMFGPAGQAYIYFTYGMHYCLNVVTGPAGHASAVLIRALQPSQGQELMEQRRGVSGPGLCNGPAKLTQALGLGMWLNGHNLAEEPMRLVPTDSRPPIGTSPRIGIKKATEYPWRFYIEGNPYVSRARISVSQKTL